MTMQALIGLFISMAIPAAPPSKTVPAPKAVQARPAPQAPVPAQTSPTATETERQALRRTPVVDVFRRTSGAVVNIQATQTVERVVPFSPFDELFGNPGRTEKYTTTALGSGFVIHPDGYVVTNAHVVSHAGVKVIFPDKSEYEADRVALDERHDLAVLKIRANRSFPAITLGRSDDLMIGETVIAIGNPLGYENTVTAGIVSATNRKLEVDENVSYDGLIQTDASINRGNSGGPLLNILGELIGINTAIRGDAQNIGFAIPVDSLRKVLPDMLSIERTRRLQVGLRLRWLDHIYVSEATGPAASGGIEPGDELISVNGQPMRQDIDYYIYLLRIQAADKLSLELDRNGHRYTANVSPQAIPNPDGAQLLRQKFGITARQLTAEEARNLRLKGGLIITAVEKGSPANQAGLVRGLVIVQIGKYFPSDVDDVGQILEDVQRNEKVVIRVWETRGELIRVLEGYLVAR